MDIFKYLQVEQIMGKFEKQFEDIDVRTSVSFNFDYWYMYINESFFLLIFRLKRRIPTCKFSFHCRPWRIP